MKNATQCAKKLTALLKKLPEPEPPEIEIADDPLEVLVESFLMTETTTEKAKAAYRRLQQHIVDNNDLRVTMPHEMVEYLGGRLPGGLERCQRIRRALRDVYLREHEVTLERLKTAGKRDVRTYLETLDGVLPYVSARVLVLCFGAHAVPVDEQLRDALIAHGAADESGDVASISAWVARQIKAGDRLVVHRKLQAWVDGGAGGKAARGTRKTTTRARGSTARKTSTPKKSSSKSRSKTG